MRSQLIGDGGMTAGMAFEALNHAGHLQEKNLVVVLNDNEMSISPNVGAMSSYPVAQALEAPMVRTHEGLGQGVPERRCRATCCTGPSKAEESLKVFFSPGLLFEALNFRYVGPIQGHRIDVLLETFENVKEMVANGERADPGARAHREGLRLRARPAGSAQVPRRHPFDVESGEFAPRRRARRSTRTSSPMR